MTTTQTTWVQRYFEKFADYWGDEWERMKYTGIQDFIEQEIEKARQEGFNKGYKEGIMSDKTMDSEGNVF